MNLLIIHNTIRDDNESSLFCTTSFGGTNQNGGTKYYNTIPLP